MTVAYLVGTVFLVLILWRVFKIFTGSGEKICRDCGEASEQIVWEFRGDKLLPVCGECLKKKGNLYV